MANSPPKRTSPTNNDNDVKAFSLPVKEENSLIIKWQDLEVNVKDEERNSLDIKGHDDVLKDPLNINDNIKEEEKNSLDITWHDDILQDPLSIKDEGEYRIEGKTPLLDV